LGVEGARRLASELIAKGTAALRQKFDSRYEVELLSEAAMMIIKC
jgi:hypothetical protein